MAAIALERTFPHSTLQDHDDVRCALTVALAAFKRGDVDDASKWLRRASRAAADAEDVMRAMELGKAAADFEQEHGSAEHLKPTASAPPSPPSSGPPPARLAPRRSSGPPPRRSGIAPRPPAKAHRGGRPHRAATQPSPSSSGAPAPRSSAAPRPPQAPRSSAPRRPPMRAPRSSASAREDLAPPPLPTFARPEQAPPPVPSAAVTLPRAQQGSDLDPTRRRHPNVAIPPPAPDFELASIMDDEEDCPTAVRSQVPQAAPSGPTSVPIALVPDRSGSFPSSPHLERVSEPGPDDELEESLNEDTIREKVMLDPPNTPDGGIPLSAARVVVVAQPSGPPEVRFLPFGASAPEGAVTAMLVTTNARDAARLADMLVGA